MYGWRARIGAIVPSTNTAVESEYNTMKPDGVSIHASRMVSLENSVEILYKLAEDTERASYELGTTMCNVIVYACTSGSFVGGPEWEAQLVKRMEKASKTNEKGLTAYTSPVKRTMTKEISCCGIATAGDFYRHRKRNIKHNIRRAAAWHTHSKPVPVALQRRC